MSDRVLIIEDEDTLRGNLARYLRGRGYDTNGVGTGAEGIAAVSEQAYDIVITDLYLEDINGVELLKQLRSSSVTAATLVMTAYGSMESSIEAFRCGVHDYILKPFSFSELDRKLAGIGEHRRVVWEIEQFRAQFHLAEAPRDIIFASPAMKDVMTLVKRAAPYRSNVLICGESGCGKELVARAVHEFSRNRDGPFVPLNVAAIPEGLVESYLFGHEKGAYTGAATAREGVFRAAAGGTLFLDEIGDLALPVQAKLLRALEEKEVTPVGADVPMKVDTRIVAATHRNLEGMVEQGEFRQDLLMRLGVVTVHVPPLRQRREDIAPLTRHLIARHCRDAGRRPLDIESSALHTIISYDWHKGNVRELSNVLERAVIMCDEDTIHITDLPLQFEEVQEAGHIGLKPALQAFEREYISDALRHAGGDRTVAARILGISLSTLYRRLDSDNG